MSIKKIIFPQIIAIILYSNFNLYAQNGTIQIGDTITKKIILTFNKDAIANNEYLKFQINEDFDFENFNLLINNEKQLTSVVKITAKEEKQIVNIRYYLKDKAKRKEYSSFNMVLSEVSSGFDDIDNSIKSDEDIGFKREVLEYPETFKDKIIGYLIYSLIGLFVLALLYLVNKKLKTFSKGTIVILEPKNTSYKLKGFTKFNSQKENCCQDTGITFTLIKGKNGRPKVSDKSASTVLIINGRPDVLGKTLNKNYTVKLVKEQKSIIFKYI